MGPAASSWLVAAAVHSDAEITVEGVCINPTRLALVGLLRRMGADIEVRATDEIGPELVGEITVRSGGPLRAAIIEDDEVAELIDELPLVAMAMASCEGTSEVRGAGELRVKESDRIAAIVAGLEAVGAEVRELPDGWTIVTKDHSLSAQWEHTVAVTADGYEILTVSEGMPAKPAIVAAAA